MLNLQFSRFSIFPLRGINLFWKKHSSCWSLSPEWILASPRRIIILNIEHWTTCHIISLKKQITEITFQNLTSDGIKVSANAKLIIIFPFISRAPTIKYFIQFYMLFSTQCGAARLRINHTNCDVRLKFEYNK